jgi:predicted DNA-binding WGR domain protein
MDYRSLRYTDEKSDKFWSIALTGCSHTVNYGRYGTDGQTQTKEFPTEDAARKSYDKLIAEKLKKGYVDDSRSERLRQREAIIVPIGFVNAPSIAVSTTPPTSVASEPATNLPDSLPINWRELAFQEIQASLVQNKKQLCELAAIDAIPSAYIFQLDVDYRIDIAKSPATHPNLLIQLSDDDRFEVRKGLASNPNLSVVVMEKFARDSNLEVRIALSKNPNTYYTALAILADDPYQKVRKNVAFHKNTPGDTIIEKSLRELSEYDRHQAKERAAGSVHSSPATLEKLAEGSYQTIHQHLACNPKAPLPVLKSMFQRFENCIDNSLSRNPAIPLHWLRQHGIDLQYRLDESPHKLIQLAESHRPHDRWFILQSDRVLEETLQVVIRKLTVSSDWYYRESCKLIVKHPNSSLSVLESLRKKIAVDAVELPAELMSELRYKIAEKIDTPIERLQELLKNNTSDLTLRQIISQHPEGYPLVTSSFLSKPQSLGYWFTLHHPYLTAEWLKDAITKSVSWFDRYAIAQNPNTPKDTLEKLAEDEHLFVRAAARSALGLEVICSPSIETLEAIAIEAPQVITTNLFVEPIPIELKIERSIDLNPEDWLWVAGRARESKSHSEPKPFDLQDALKRLKQIEGEAPDRQRKLAGYFSIDWNNAEIAPNLSLEEANFWLTAMTCDLPIIGGRPSGYWNKQNLDALVELLEGMCFKSLPDFRQIIYMLLRNWRAIHSPILRPLNNLFSIIEIIIDIDRFHQSDDLSALRYIESVFDRDYLEKYAADRPAYSPEQVIQSMAIVLRNEARSLLDRLVQGFKSFIHPYLTGKEIQVMQEQLRPALNLQTNAFHLYKLAAYLGMDEEVRAQIATWQLNQPTSHFVKTTTGHLQSIEAIEIVFGLGNPAEIETNVRNLNLPISKPEHIRVWFANMGFTALDLVGKCILTEEQLAVFTLAKAPEVAPYMLELWLSLKKPQLARQWLEDYPIDAVVGLIPVVAGTWVDPVHVKTSELKKAAIDFLLSMKRKGHEPLIRSALERETPEIAAKVRSLILDLDEPNYIPFDRATTPQWLQAGILDLPKQKRSKPPAWVSYADLPPIVIGDRCLDEAQINACLSALSLSTLDSPLPLVQQLKTHANPQTLDTFSWSLFDRWLTEGAPNKEKWAMMALGLLGSDRIALKLTPLIRTWPGESQHARAVLGLECLRSIGTDTALMQIHGIAQKIKFQGLKSRAQDCMEAIARDRQLTAEQLADRIIPDCGLDEKGQRSFDFGARQFQFLLGLDLKPMLRDPQGKKITTLPKPNSKDDPELAERAIADWKLMKKQISEVAKLHSLRLERAMVEHRTWNWQDFETLLVRHPLLTHLVQRIIWATYDLQGTLQTTFRIAEDRTYTDDRDNPYQPDSQAIVGIPHPLTLDTTTKSLWGEILSDYEIIPPFPQLSRDTYIPTDAERDAEEIDRFAKIPVPGALLARMMDDLGWLKGALHDHGDYHVHYKYFPQGDVTAIIGDYEYQHVQQSSSYDAAMNGCLFLKGESAQPYEYPRTGSWYAQHSKIQCLKLGEVDFIVISEVIRDMNSIVSAARTSS